MSTLPSHPSLEHLKKLAKQRLRELRASAPGAKLASALLEVAREYGFPSWRALKAEVERRNATTAQQMLEQVRRNDVTAVRALIEASPAASRAEQDQWTALHEAAKRGHAEIVELLVAHGADVHAREPGDNTTPLHWAAAGGHVEIVRRLLDAGADVDGRGDVHGLDVIGWAACFERREDVVALLLERGARHHIFSAIASADVATIRELVEDNPDVLEQRMSRFEQRQSPLHRAIERLAALEVLIELGAELDARDASGRTAL
jgi:ankyrin repeat protein